MNDQARIVVTQAVLTPAPAVGEFMAGAGAAVYRILDVTVLRQAGVQTPRYRLRCAPVAAADLPSAATVHPWRLAARRPHKSRRDAMAPTLTSPLLRSMGVRDRAMLERLRVKAPLLLAMGLEPVLQARTLASKQQAERVARVGRDRGVIDRADCGHGLRMSAVRSADGTLLREADVAVAEEDAEEPGARRKVRRARRADPLATLRTYKSITEQQYDAAERLRAAMEAATPSLGGAAQSDVHLAPWARIGVTGRQIEACATVRAALTGIAPRDQLALAWVLAGGTIMGLAAFARISDQKAATSLRRALDAVVDFFADADKETAA